MSGKAKIFYKREPIHLQRMLMSTCAGTAIIPCDVCFSKFPHFIFYCLICNWQSNFSLQAHKLYSTIAPSNSWKCTCLGLVSSTFVHFFLATLQLFDFSCTINYHSFKAGIITLCDSIQLAMFVALFYMWHDTLME